MTTVYTDPVTVTRQLDGMTSVVVEHADIAPVQCEHCGDVDALVAARVYADGDRYAEICPACAPHVAAEFSRLTDRDVLVEIDLWRCA